MRGCASKQVSTLLIFPTYRLKFLSTLSFIYFLEYANFEGYGKFFKVLGLAVHVLCMFTTSSVLSTLIR